jgi:cyanophycinase
MKGDVKITTGLAFIANVIIDSHFVTRGRFGRLVQAVAANPGCIGIGLGEDTGVLITQGNYMEAIGSGLVIIFDGHNIRHSNLADLQEGSPISIEQMVVHVMAKGNSYNLKERKFFAEAVPMPINQ